MLELLFRVQKKTEPDIGQMAASTKKNIPIVVLAPREVPSAKFYGGGGARDTRRFVEEVKAAWSAQRCETEQEKRGILWSHLGEEVRRELTCLLDGHTRDPQRMLQTIATTYGERRSVLCLLGSSQSTRQRHGETCRAFSHRLRDAFDNLLARQHDTDVTMVSRRVLCDHFADSLLDLILPR